jgi:ATP-dependent Clp protease ATP-binding subunit ClpA
LANVVERIHQRAFDLARDFKNSIITFEHVLLAITDTDEGLEILRDLRCNVDELRRDLTQHIQTFDQDLDADTEIAESAALTNFREMLLVRMILNSNRELSIADIFDGIFRQRESFAAYFLEKQGITRARVLRYITHGMAPSPAEPTGEMAGGEAGDDGQNTSAESPDKVLKAFTVNMTEEARAGKYDALIAAQKSSAARWKFFAAATRTTRCTSANRAWAKQRSCVALRRNWSLATCRRALPAMKFIQSM